MHDIIGPLSPFFKCFLFFVVVAFIVAYNQNKQLIGENGLMPCKSYLNSVKRYVGGKIGTAALAYTPSILWFLDWSSMDTNLDCIALLGMALSGFVLVTGTANMLIMGTLWVLYHSLVSVGQLWYSFGWESQLLETGFLAIFLCPVWTLSQVPHNCPPSLICIWTFRWLIVRIMLGAGLIKIRGDKCWRDLTCMDYHYETQPVPNPMSYYMHRSPWWFHRFETLSNHFIELIAPFFTFLGRRMCSFNGAIQILFQVVLIISGNLSFLNWLTIVPSLACFDDASLSFLFRFGSGAKKAVMEIQRKEATGKAPKPSKGMLVRRVVNISLGVLIGCLSVPVVINLLSPRQVMNTSFDPLRIVNTYGAFGSSSMTYEQSEWIIHIAGRLLSNDSTVLSLLDYNPFQGREPPRWVRGEHFRYKFTQPGSASAAQGKWWLRKRIGAYFPAVDLEGLRGFFQSRNWPHPHIPSKRS
ncbi:PREDICTED: lipase maturation factor 1 [Cyprinodon variegatus]|uniref:lipase maturation factor 1 n=1 Tax=Cyprinodon variegatus TaxID=28743 RepID=UPI0007429218|nr:PREDICTED: lipase maturation factor 1 [Cyprinodon variegatus]